MLLHVSLAGSLGVLSRVKRMASSRVGMMCGFLVVPTIVMLGRFAVMVGGVGRCSAAFVWCSAAFFDMTVASSL